VEQPEEVSRPRAALQPVSIILPVVNETISLERTFDIILRDAADRICKIIIVICSP
jgi:hypothetical protein